MLALNQLDRIDASPGQVKPKVIKVVFVAALISGYQPHTKISIDSVVLV